MRPPFPAVSSALNRGRRRGLFDRILVLLVVILLLYVLLRPLASTPIARRLPAPLSEAYTPHDAVGIVAEHNNDNNNAKQQQAVDRTAESRAMLTSIRNGVDYNADYDITKIVAPEPYRTVGGPPASLPLKFRYMNETSSKWPLRWVSKSPRIALVPNFLTYEECDALIAAALPAMTRSLVADRQGGASKLDPVRTSSQTWLSVTDGIGATIANRIYELTSFPPGSSELLQILRYELGQKYNSHLDYFDPAMYGPQATNRAMTVYLYLSDVEEGGHTWFPHADNNKVPVFDTMECKRGFAMKPKKGAVVVFYDMTPEGDYDPMSQHGSCPVKKGVKFGGTLWFRIPTA